MATATFLSTHTKDDVTQATYELSEPISYKRWNGKKVKTKHVVVSHTRLYGENETAVFPSTEDGKIKTYSDLFTSVPICDDATALSALGFTL